MQKKQGGLPIEVDEFLNAIGLYPRLRRATEQWHEEFTDQALPLKSSLTVIVHDPTVIEEHHELRH